MNVRIRLISIVLLFALLLPGCGKETKEDKDLRNSYETPFAGTQETHLPKVGDAQRQLSPEKAPTIEEGEETKVPEASKEPEETKTPVAKAEAEIESKEASTKEKEEDYVVVKITHIDWEYFLAEAPWQSNIKYIIHAKLGDEYCEGDYVDVVYKDIYELEDNQYELDALDVTESTYVSQGDVDYKPVIYLYPKKETKVNVKLQYSGAITVSSPEYKDGWVVTAKPDGSLIGEDGKQYENIFWEGIREMSYDLSEGFCVSGTKTKEFLQEKLRYMGLNEKEVSEFLKFWIPYMKGNAYNLISFQGSAYTDNAKLNITPKPDSMLRVYMVFKPLKAPVKIKEQKLVPFKRSGFTVVEWGGTIQ